jgi:hypothetical protein
MGTTGNSPILDHAEADRTFFAILDGLRKKVLKAEFLFWGYCASWFTHHALSRFRCAKLFQVLPRHQTRM